MLHFLRGLAVPPRARAFLARHPRLVRGRLRRADRRADRRLGRDRLGPARAGLRAHRIGQDARRLPVGHRSPGGRSRSAIRACGCSTSRRSRRSRSTSSRTCAHRWPASARAAVRLEVPPPAITTALRTGDTPAEERRRLVKHPPDILVTTPESLFLLLTSAARDILRTVETVIVDEVHAVAGTKRGSHLALSLERLDCLLRAPAQRIGLSATVRPLEEVARFLGGAQPVTVVAAPADKPLDLSIVVPVEDLGALGRPAGPVPSGSASGAEERTSVWPHVEERLLELIRAHRSTIVFANSRRLAERLCARLNELAERRWPARTTAPSAASSAGRSRRRCARAACRPSSRRPRSSSASTWARSISSCRSRRRPRWPRASSASVAPGTRLAPSAVASSSRSIAATCSSARSSWSACGRAQSRRCATRATRSTCWRSRS